MNPNPSSPQASAASGRRPLLLIVVSILVVAALYFVLRPAKNNGSATAYYEVKRGDFTVSVVEGGTLAAVSEVSIRNEVEGTSRIISIVPEGSYVKKGDLLVELDSAQAQDQVNQQLINYEKAKFAVEQAKAQLEIAKSATNSDFMTADLKVKFARIDERKYKEGQRAVDLVEATNKLIQVLAQLKVNEDSYSNSVTLAEKGYETRQKVDGDYLSVLNNRNSLTVASNGIWILKEFDVPKLTDKYESDVRQAQQELERVVSQNKRKMAQYEADLDSQENTLALSKSKLDRDQKNLGASKIYAPQEGLVVYQISENRFSSESLIEGGAVVRNRQELIKLPDLSRMKVTVKIHESHVNMIRPGLPAFVTLDSMPDTRFAGIVEKVAPLPDNQARWGNPNLKVYNTDIYVTDPLPNVKPGVSAKAEIIITNIASTLFVPIQAITTLKGKQVAYVTTGAKQEPRSVEAGLFNTKFIEVTQGLKEGDRVLLSPPFDMQDKDLDGSVLTAEEKAKVKVTNSAGAKAVGAPAARQQQAVPPEAQRPGVGQEAQTQPGLAPEGGRAAGGRGAGGGFNREEMMKQYDKNGDGELDETERAAMREAMAARFGAQGGPGGQGRQGGQRLSQEEMLKRFDKNSDGELDETERAAMRTELGASRTNRTERRRDSEDGTPRAPRGDGASGESQGDRGGGRAPSE
jgi:HlyD family secretion protein